MMPSYVVIFFEPIARNRSFVKGPETDQTFLADNATQACVRAAIQERKSGLFSATSLTNFSSNDVTIGFAGSPDLGIWDPVMTTVASADGGTPFVDGSGTVLDGGAP